MFIYTKETRKKNKNITSAYANIPLAENSSEPYYMRNLYTIKLKAYVLSKELLLGFLD